MDEKQKVLELLELLNKDFSFKDFRLRKEFIEAWEKYIKGIDSKVVYFIPNQTDKDQIYIFELPIDNWKMEFTFSIKYIRDFYMKYPNCKQKLIFTNTDGRLFNGENECCYTRIEDKDIANVYSDKLEAFVIPFPQKQYNFLAIDGNHRINQRVHLHDAEIETLYVNYKMAARSLATPMQICAYCILEDFAKIKYNMNNYSHEKLFSTTNICNKERTFDVIGSNRKR